MAPKNRNRRPLPPKADSAFDLRSSRMIPSLGLAAAALLLVAVVAAVFFHPAPSRQLDNRSDKAGAPPGETEHWQPEEQAKAYARYAGSKSCRECHQDQFGLWLGSDHQLAERLPGPKMDAEAFNPHRELKQPHRTSSMYTEGGLFHFATQGASGKQDIFEVERVIGETPIRQYLVKFPRGLLQAVDLSHDPHKDEWFNVFGDEEIGRASCRERV